jgi:hypothetical protein
MRDRAMPSLSVSLTPVPPLAVFMAMLDGYNVGPPSEAPCLSGGPMGPKMQGDVGDELWWVKGLVSDAVAHGIRQYIVHVVCR